MSIPGFPKIFSLGTDYIRDLFNEEVEITEKVDGSQFAFGKVDGKLHTRSKGAVIYPESLGPNDMFRKVVDFVHNLSLPDNTVYYCEYLRVPHHNTLTYNRVPRNNLVLFGLIRNGRFEGSRQALLEEASQLEIDAIPQLWKGKLTPGEDALRFVKSLVDYESFLGGPKIEGVVVKNYARPFLLGGQPIPLMAGKFVSEAFKEVNHKTWAKENTSRGKWGVFVEGYKTEARWEKSIQALRDAGKLTNSPKDIGLLIKAVQADIVAEESEAIKDFLFKEFGKDLLRRATAGLPEYYKGKLLERAVSGGGA